MYGLGLLRRRALIEPYPQQDSAPRANYLRQVAPLKILILIARQTPHLCHLFNSVAKCEKLIADARRR